MEIAGPNIVLGGPEETRRQLLNHEASIKSIGLLYLLGSIILVILGIISFVSAISAPQLRGTVSQIATTVSVAFFLLGVLQAFVAVGLRKLQRWTRIPVGIVSGIGLLSFPIGTLINGYILYLVFSQKGSQVFSPEYQEIIRQTPHIRYRTSILVKILAFLLLLILSLGVLVAFLG